MRSLVIFRRWLLGAAVMLLVACSSGGGGGGDDPENSRPIIGVASEYWSADTAGVWFYDGRDHQSGRTYRNRATIAPSMNLGGRTLIGFSYSLPFNDPAVAGTQYRSYETDGVHAYLEATPTDVAQSYLELPSDIRQGTYTAYRNTETAPEGTLTMQIDVTVVGFERLSLPAGDVVDALKAEQRFTATLTAGGVTTSASSTLHLWYAKGLGIVKQTLDDPTAVPNVGTYVEELAGVMAGPTRAGVVSELRPLDDLAPAVSSLTTGRPGVASDGAGYLVAARRLNGATQETEIVAAYVDGKGQTVWNKTAIANLGNATGTGSYDDPVAVAFNGSNFWIVARSSALNSTTLLRQRIALDGTLLDPPGGTAIADGTWPVLASNGSSVLFLAARSEGEPLFDRGLYGTLFAPDGAPIHSEQLVALPGAGNSGYASATASGGQYLVSFQLAEPRDIHAVRIGSTGTLLDLAPIVLSTGPNSRGNSAVAAWGATGFAALWPDARGYAGTGGGFDIYGARIDGGGSLLDGPPAGGGILLDRRASERFGVAAASGAKGSLLAWTRGSFSGSSTETSGVFARRFAGGELAVADPASDGLLLGLASETPGARLMAPAVAASATGHLAVWVVNEEAAGQQKSVRGALVFPPLAAP